VAPPDESPLRTLVVALVVCAVCSIVVSATAVLLAPLQAARRSEARRASLERLIARQPELREMLGEGAEHAVHEVVVDLSSGEVADWMDAADVDVEGALLDPARSVAIPKERDLAGLGRRPLLATAVLVEDRGRVAMILLPVHGQGYASTIRGYVALDRDANTLRGVAFHEHGETPGVGGDVLADEDWLAEWQGRRIRDESGRVRIGASIAEVHPDGPDAPYVVDAVTGATRTTMGVGNLLRFWLGDDGFGPFLQRLAREGGAR
jgi:Na+-transporting NADH:ubiquinone oxidoreductase subunit C